MIQEMQSGVDTEPGIVELQRTLEKDGLDHEIPAVCDRRATREKATRANVRQYQIPRMGKFTGTPAPAASI